MSRHVLHHQIRSRIAKRSGNEENKLREVAEELRKLQKPIHNANVRHKESLSLLEKFAVKLNDHVGSDSA
jgi:hypothetical protein